MGRIDAWVYEADVHCNDCKHKRFGDNDAAIDNEGNVITPIFSWDYVDINQGCGECREYIRDAYVCDTCKQRNYSGITCNECFNEEKNND